MADRKIFIDDSPKNPKLKRSPFDWTYTNNMTGRFGRVNVCFFKYLPPNSKFKCKPFFAFDMMPLVYPIQTNVRCHVKFFKIPLRILWKDFEDFCSQIGTNGLPTNGGGTQFVVPYIKRPSGWNGLHSLAEQIGCCNLVESHVNTSIVAKASVVSFDFHGHVISNNISASNGVIRIDIPENYILHKYEIGSNTCDGFIKFLTSSAVPTGFTGSKLTFSLVPVKSDGSLGNVLASEDLAYSSSLTSQTFSLSDYTNFALSGVNYRQYGFYYSFSSDSPLYTVSQKLQSIGVRYVLIVTTSSSAVRSVLFYNYNNSDKIVLKDTDISYTKVDLDSGNLTSTLQNNNVYINFGLFSDVDVCVQYISESTTTIYDSVDNADPVLTVCALPFRALEFIHNYFMRNNRIDPFVKDGNPSYNKFLTNVDSGADTTTPVESWNALYETDYFTSCVKEPQFGNAPLVGVTVNDMSDKGILRFSDGENSANDYQVEVPIGEDGAVLPITMYSDIADRPNVQRLQELISYGISINDLRNVSTFQRMLERMQRTGHRFQNVIYEFFGTNPPIGDHFPQYIGGVTRNITVDKITNTTKSEDAKLGEFAGDGYFRGEGKKIQCFTTEPSYIVGIQYFTVTPTYSQALPKHLLYKNPLDFYLDPDFAYVGPQPVYVKEIAPNQVPVEDLDDVFGYNRPYAELFSNLDEVHGLFRTNMSNFLLQRVFGSTPQLNKSFIEINSDDLLNIFSVVENEDKCYGQIKFKCHVDLPAPRSYLPRSI